MVDDLARIRSVGLAEESTASFSNAAISSSVRPGEVAAEINGWPTSRTSLNATAGRADRSTEMPSASVAVTASSRTVDTASLTGQSGSSSQAATRSSFAVPRAGGRRNFQLLLALLRGPLITSNNSSRSSTLRARGPKTLTSASLRP